MQHARWKLTESFSKFRHDEPLDFQLLKLDETSVKFQRDTETFRKFQDAVPVGASCMYAVLKLVGNFSRFPWTATDLAVCLKVVEVSPSFVKLQQH